MLYCSVAHCLEDLIFACQSAGMGMRLAPPPPPPPPQLQKQQQQQIQRSWAQHYRATAAVRVCAAVVPRSAWTEHTSPGGRFYYNAQTNQSTYEKPQVRCRPGGKATAGTIYWHCFSCPRRKGMVTGRLVEGSASGCMPFTRLFHCRVVHCAPVLFVSTYGAGI